MADNDSSSGTMIVALVAIIVIVALGFLLYRGMYLPAGNTSSQGSVDINLPTIGGNTSGGGQ